jgi:hypothetical protein
MVAAVQRPKLPVMDLSSQKQKRLVVYLACRLRPFSSCSTAVRNRPPSPTHSRRSLVRVSERSLSCVHGDLGAPVHVSSDMRAAAAAMAPSADFQDRAAGAIMGAFIGDAPGRAPLAMPGRNHEGVKVETLYY